MFEPGQKVVCVDDKFAPEIAKLYEQLPVKDVVYTVRDILPGQTIKCEETVTVYLKEIRNTTSVPSVENPELPSLERGFACHRFTELEEIQEVKYKKYEYRELVEA